MNTEVIKEWKKTTLSDLDYICKELDDVLDKPSVIFIEGEVGAGKTTFVKSFIPQKETFSPSYSLINESGMFLHADFYRLESENDLVELEIELYLEDKNYLLIEWGKNFYYQLKRILPEEFSYYVLNIDIKESCQNDYRDFTLSDIS